MKPAGPARTSSDRAAGDRARPAFSAVAEEWVDAVFTVCLRMLGRLQDAEDATQEALARAYAHWDQYDPHAPLRPWLLTIAANVCRDRLRTVWWRRVLFSSALDAEESLAGTMAYDERERDRKVRAALLTLPTKYREALSLFHLEEMTYEEMSEILGANVPALKQRVRRGREMLGQILERRYPELRLERTDGEKASE